MMVNVWEIVRRGGGVQIKNEWVQKNWHLRSVRKNRKNVES